MLKLPKTILQHKNKGLTLLDQGIVSGGNFILGILFARFLGLEGYGRFTAVWLVVMFFAGIHQGLLIKPMLSLFGKQEKPEEFLKGLFCLQILFSGLCFLLAAVILKLGYFLPEWGGQAFWPLPVWILLSQLHEFQRRAMMVKGRFVAALRMDMISFLVMVGGPILLQQTGHFSLTSALLVLCCAYGSGLLTENVWGQLIPPSVEKASSASRLSWNFGKWLAGASLLQWFSGNGFILAAGKILGPAALGGIRMAQNTVGVLNVLFLAFENYIPPQAARVFTQGSRRGLLHFLKDFSWKGAIMVLLPIAVLAGFSQQIILMVFGAEYLPYTGLLQAFALFNLLVFLGMPVRICILTMGRTREIFLGYALTTLFAFVLAGPLVSGWGLSGMLIGLIATQIIMTGWLLFKINQSKNYEKDHSCSLGKG